MNNIKKEAIKTLKKLEADERYKDDGFLVRSLISNLRKKRSVVGYKAVRLGEHLKKGKEELKGYTIKKGKQVTKNVANYKILKNS